MSPQAAVAPPLPPASPAANGSDGHSSAVTLAVADLRASKTNPRKTFDPAFIAELAGSMKRHGFISTILVRPHATEKGAFEIVAGEQRFRAAKEAGLTHVQALVRSLEDNEVLELQIIENLTRRDLTPLEEADGYSVLMRAKYTVEHIAEKIGRTGQYVRDRCRLLKLVGGARELLQQGRIEVGHAIQLARISPEDQVRTIRFPSDTEGDGAGRDSGLWQRQRDLPGTVDTHGDWKGEGWKPVSTRELQAWIQDHVRLKPEAEQTADLFPEMAKLFEEAQTKEKGVKPVRYIEITLDHGAAADVRDPSRRIYGRSSYARADGKDGEECANSVWGFVVAGPGQGEMLKVCVDKKRCQVHYKAEIAAREKREAKVAKSGTTGADREALERAEREKAEAREADKRREQVERRKRAQPAVVRALVEAALAAPFGKLQAGLQKMFRDFPLGEKQMGAPKTADEFMRVAWLSVCLGGMANFTADWVSDWEIKQLERSSGVDVAKIIATANASGSPAAPKPAKSKPLAITKPPKAAPIKSAKKSKGKK